MTGINPGLIGIEALAFILAITILVLDLLFHGRRPRAVTLTAVLGSAAVLAYALVAADTGVAWHGMIRVDAAALFFKRLVLAASVLTMIMIGRSSDTQSEGRAEYYALTAFATVGMLFMAAAHNLVVLFMALELLTITFYILVAYARRDDLGLEAGLKYLVIGTVSAAFILLGIAFVYGAAGSLAFDAIAAKAGMDEPDAVLVLGMIILLLGLGFKVSAIPFHAWAPDVYQGAPTPVAAFLSVGSKAAGFVLLLRLLFSVFLPARGHALTVLMAVAVLTLAYGNLGAIPQTNIKRLLGYSGISQAGYLLLGLIAGSAEGGAAIIYFLAGYLFTNMLAFLVIILWHRKAGSFDIASYAGLGKTSPLLAAALLIALLSLAGAPPLVGFFGKFLLISSVVQAGYSWLAIVAAVNVVVGMYYYLLVVKAMYVREPTAPSAVTVSPPMQALLYLCVTAILGLGLFQGPLYKLALTAANSLIL